MIDQESLVIGRVYFQATYEDTKLSRPVILSFEYLGKDIHGAPEKSEDSGYYFKFLPPFLPGDEDGLSGDYPTDGSFVFSSQELESTHDLNGLIAELQTRCSSWLGSGQ